MTLSEPAIRKDSDNPAESPQSPPRPSSPAILGTVALFTAVGLVILSIIDRSFPLPFMPVSWHANRALWYLITLALFLSGIVILWRHRVPAKGNPVEEQEESEGDHSLRPAFQRVVLYTRQSCPLCEEAKTVLAEFGPQLPPVEEIDIEADPALHSRFDTCVPVVELDGRVRFRGRVNRVLLRRLIEAAGSETPSAGRPVHSHNTGEPGE